MDTAPTPGEAAQAEAAKQLVALAFAIAGVCIMLAVERKMRQPDWWRTRKMASARREERLYATAAAWAWRRAETARKSYERETA
jgi:hypothetical protein